MISLVGGAFRHSRRYKFIMKFFIDTAKVEDIKKANDMGVICGVTIRRQRQMCIRDRISRRLSLR